MLRNDVNFNPKEQCNWEGSSTEVEIHLKQCKHRLIPCKYSDCKERIKFCLLNTHLHTCLFRKVTCEYCNMQYVFSEREIHEMFSLLCIEMESISREIH